MGENRRTAVENRQTILLKYFKKKNHSRDGSGLTMQEIKN